MEKRFNLKELLNQRSIEQPEGEIAEGQENSGYKEETGNPEVMMIDVFDLEPSRENFYLVDDSLKRSVELVGILQPLLVNRKENGKYKVIAGHRRRLAVLSLVKEGNETRRYVPCVFKKEDVRDRLAIIMANRFRDKTDWERMMEAVEAEGLAKELKKDYKLGGRTRGVLAELTGLSEAQLGRYKAIFNNLDKGLMEDFKADRISFTAASELCGLSQERQMEAGKLLKEKGALSLQEIKELKRQEEQKQKLIEASSDRKCGKEEERLKESVIREDQADGWKSDSLEQHEKQENKGSIPIRDISKQIIELFENFLIQYNITIPGSENGGEGGDNSTRLYGSVYAGLLDDIEDILKELPVQSG